MKQADINRVFTEKVSAYLADGWTFHPQTCNATSASSYCMDLTDGKHLVRISIDDFHDYENDLHGKDVMVRRILREAEPHVELNGSRYDWLDDHYFDLPCDQTRFWRVNADDYKRNQEPYYTNSEDEAIEAHQKRRARWTLRHDRDHRNIRNSSIEREFQDEETLALAKSYVKRKTGLRSVRKDLIQAFRMVHTDSPTDSHYQVWYSGTRI